MKKKIIYTDEPMGDIKIIEDFLPPPDKLVFRQPRKKVTISLSNSSIAFFKNQAAKHKVSYQKMIRNLLDRYVAEHSK